MKVANYIYNETSSQKYNLVLSHINNQLKHNLFINYIIEYNALKFIKLISGVICKTCKINFNLDLIINCNNEFENSAYYCNKLFNGLSYTFRDYNGFHEMKLSCDEMIIKKIIE